MRSTDVDGLTWRIHEVKVHQIVDAQLLQLQHDRPQVGPEDFGVRVVLGSERGPRLARRRAQRNQTRKAFTCLHLGFVGLLRVKPEAFPRTRPAGSPRPLLGGGLTDGGDQQRLHPDARVVNLKTRLKTALN